MLKKLKQNYIYILIGIVAGVVIVIGAAVLLYLALRAARSPETKGSLAKQLGKKVVEAFQKDESFDLKIPKEKDFAVFIVSSLDKIFQDGKALSRPELAAAACDLELAKNERGSFQFVVSSNKKPLKSVWLEIEEFSGNSEARKIQTKWRVVGYVPTEKPYYPAKYVGRWPDPLLPLKKVDINPGFTQPFWVNVYVPKDVPAGIYQSKIKLICEARVIAEIPLVIKVFNFELPLANHLKTAFDFYGHITSQRYPKKEQEAEDEYSLRIAIINETFMINMLLHRMNPILNIDPVNPAELIRVDNYRRLGLSNFSIGKRGGTFNNNWPEDEQELEGLLPLYRAYGETLKFNKLFDLHYIYTWDEGKIGDPRVAKVASMIHRAHPELKNMVCYNGFWEPDKDPQWGKDIDIWCFQIDSFNEEKMLALKNLGKEIWVYVSGPGSSGSPNLAIDFDAIDCRIIPWLCWKYNIKGFLYWCVNWWPYVDPFESAANTKWQQNGNGLLFYPGENGPMDSLRAEIFRDGMEDYEYLYLLAQKVEMLKKQKPDSELIKEAEKLLTVDYSIAASMSSFTHNPRPLLLRRQKIAALIEKIGDVP